MSITRPSAIALIPARSGSRRIPHKNIYLLQGHPMLAYAVVGAMRSGVFDSVVVSTDSAEYADIARRYGADVPGLRPVEYAGEKSPDIEWVEELLTRLKRAGRTYDCFSILRPTSPFRKPETIRRAWDAFVSEVGIDSLRAVEKCREHPGKMWVIRNMRMSPLLPLTPLEMPWHSSQYAALPEVYVQNASLEIARSRVVFENRSIAGDVLMPFLTRDYEGFDINDPYDLKYAEDLISRGLATLPHMDGV